MYPPSSVCTKYGEPKLYGNKKTDLSQTFDINFIKSVDPENEVNVR